MTNKVKFEERRKATGLQKSFLAKQLGISPSTFYNKMEGKNEFKQSEIRILCNLMHIDDFETLNDIFFFEGE